MYGLLKSQQSNNQKLVSFTFGWKIIGLTRSALTLHPTRSN